MLLHGFPSASERLSVSVCQIMDLEPGASSRLASAATLDLEGPQGPCERRKPDAVGIEGSTSGREVSVEPLELGQLRTGRLGDVPSRLSGTTSGGNHCRERGQPGVAEGEADTLAFVGNELSPRLNAADESASPPVLAELKQVVAFDDGHPTEAALRSKAEKALAQARIYAKSRSQFRLQLKADGGEPNRGLVGDARILLLETRKKSLDDRADDGFFRHRPTIGRRSFPPGRQPRREPACHQ